MFNSGLIDVSPKKNVASKFSQANEIPACIGGFSDIVGGMNVSTGLHGSSGIGGVDFSPKKHKGSFGNELHKQALMNSHNRKESQVKIKNNEMVPEENCHVLRDWEGKKGGINKKTSAFERK